MPVQIIQLPTGRIELRPDGIVVFRPSGVLELTETDVRAYLDTARQHVGDKAYLLIDRRAGYALTFEAQEVLRTEMGQYAAALAYLTRPSIGFTVASMTAHQLSKQLPVQVFTSEESAVEWLINLSA